jgi:hypothetical protein
LTYKYFAVQLANKFGLGIPKEELAILSNQEVSMILKTGQEAPDFVLPSHLDQSVRLSDYRGKKNVVLAFFPMAWTPI